MEASSSVHSLINGPLDLSAVLAENQLSNLQDIAMYTRTDICIILSYTAT